MDKKTIIYIILLAASFYFVQVFFAPKPTPITKEKHVLKEEKVENEQSENFYVLENEYQQLVFSDIGGSLVEINLPLNTKDKKSVINPVEFDEEILKNYSENSLFPQKPYYAFGFKKKENTLGGYYPLLRRSIYNKQKQVEFYVSPKYYALDLQGEDFSFSFVKFKVVKFEKDLIEFEGEYKGKRVTKTFYFDKNVKAPYVFNLDVTLDNKNLYLSSGALSLEISSNRSMYDLRYKTERNKIINISLPKDKKPTSSNSNYIDWISNSNGFFGIIIDPLNSLKNGFLAKYIPGKKAPTRISVIDAEYNLYPPQKYPSYDLFLPIKKDKKNQFRIFAGPYQDNILKSIDDIYSKPLIGYNPNYIKVKAAKGWFSFASEPFSKFLFIIMNLFYKITHSWGFSIILLTIVFRIMLFPLNSWSIKSTLKMQEVTPLIKVIDAKYKKDPKRANIEKMKLFKEKGANPFSGCLPLLIQLPFLFGMFNLLRTTFDLRGVSFIPGWIDNLTSPDILFTWKYPLFFIGRAFHLLPILLGAVMFVQSKMNMKVPKDRTKLTDQQKQQVIMVWVMPLVFVLLFYKAASGLNIYFLFSMFLGILQQMYMAKKKKKVL